MSSSSGNDVQSRVRCRCGAYMKIHISHSERNPLRRYWKCHNLKDGVMCGGFIWADEVESNLACDVEWRENQTTALRELNCNMIEIRRDMNRILLYANVVKLTCTVLVVIFVLQWFL